MTTIIEEPLRRAPVLPRLRPPLPDGALAQELYCRGCGYGIVVRPLRQEPACCPMCRGGSWLPRAGAGRWN